MRTILQKIRSSIASKIPEPHKSRLRLAVDGQRYMWQLKRQRIPPAIYIACRNSFASVDIERQVNALVHRDICGVKKYVKPGDVVIDAGANIGIFSIYSGLTSQSVSVYAFEPEERSFGLLKKNVKDAGMFNITPINKGLGSVKGRKNLRVVEGYRGSSYVEDAERDNIHHLEGAIYKQQKIDVTTLDEFASERGIKIGFIKIDTEGSEQKVLEGAKRVIKTQEPTIAIVVSHSKNHPTQLVKTIKEINPEYSLIEKRKYDGEEVFILATKSRIQN